MYIPLTRPKSLFWCLLVALAPGCGEEATGSLASRSDVHGDSMDSDGCHDPTESNPVMGCLEIPEFAMKACDTGGASTDDLRLERKQFYKTQPECTPLPTDLRCRIKSAESGADWPSVAEQRIQEASAASGGFSDQQIQALRYLASLEPSEMITVIPGEANARAPSAVHVMLTMPQPAQGVSIHQQTLQQFGALVGTILGVDSAYEFQMTTKQMGDAAEIRLTAIRYKGVPIDPSHHLRIDIDLGGIAWPGEGRTNIVCSNQWLFAGFTSTLSRHIETLETDPSKLVSAQEAIASALAACGDACTYPVDSDYASDPKPELVINSSNVVWRVLLNCPVPECDNAMFYCGYSVDALTGNVLDGGVGCCIDCR